MHGSALDPLFWIVMVTGLFFVGILTLYISNQVNSGMRSGLESAGMDAVNAEKVFGGVSNANITFSKMMMVVMILAMVAGLTFASLIAVHPIFIFISLLISSFAIVGAIVGHDMIAALIDAVPAMADVIPGTLLFWGNILQIISAYIVINLLVMYLAYQRGAGLS